MGCLLGYNVDKTDVVICDSWPAGFRIAHHLTAGYDPGHKFPASGAIGQMCYHKLAILGRNPVFNEGSGLFAAQVSRLFPVSAFPHHARSSQPLGTFCLLT
jgi:hypothetical protein